MEYLVEMTTRVPDGVSETEVAEMRAKEAATTRELAASRRVLRLWRPPVLPGEWHTRGLFSARDRADLGETLGSMPLHVWRRDVVTPLRPHPNDPGLQEAELDPDSVEFFTTFVLKVPGDATAARVEELSVGEARRVRELAAAGRILRLWALPGDGHSLGHWQVRGGEELQADLRSLPLADWLTITTERLTRHPNDPTPNRGRQVSIP